MFFLSILFCQLILDNGLPMCHIFSKDNVSTFIILKIINID